MSEAVRIDQPLGRGEQRGGQDHEVGLAEELVQFGQGEDLLHSVGSSLLRMLTNRNDTHAKARRYSSHSASDASHTDEAKRGAGNLLGMLPLVPDSFLSPDAFLLEQNGLRNFLGQGKH